MTVHGLSHPPILAEAVIYRGKTGLQTRRAAIIVATVASLDPQGLVTGQVRGLDTNTHVHLWVFTPGGPGFSEDNVPMCPDDQPLQPGTWTWNLDPGRP